MNIGILSFRPSDKKAAPEELRLKNEAIQRGHKAQILRSQFCTMYFNDELRLIYKDKTDFKKFDVIIPRVSLTQNVTTRSAIIEQAQLLNIPVVNSFYSIIRAKNKLHTLQILNHYNIPVVKTIVIQNEEYLSEALNYIDTPVIIKTSYGSYGKGVVIAETKRAAKSAYNLISNSIGAHEMILLQEYIKESKGKDIRVFVVGNNVAASMERSARKGEFRSNMELGGTSKAIKPNAEIRNIAVKAAKALELEVAGVDIILTKNGPEVMEVNANPGFKGLEEVTGVNIAERIIQHAETHANRFISKIEL